MPREYQTRACSQSLCFNPIGRQLAIEDPLGDLPASSALLGFACRCGPLLSTFLIACLVGCAPSAAERQRSAQRRLRCLIAEVQSEHEERFDLALSGLSEVGPSAAPALQALLGRLDRRPENAALRRRTVEVLGRVGAMAATALPAALAISSRYPDMQPSLRKAVHSIGPNALPVLIALALRHASVLVRHQAVLLLAEFPEAQSVDTLIVAMTQDLDPAVRRAAANALGRLEAQAAGPALSLALGDTDGRTVLAAARALAALGEAGRARLRAAMFGPDATASTAAALALPELGARASQVVSLWLKALHDSRASVRSAAAKALSRLGPQVIAQVAPLLEALLDDPAVSVQEAAEDALAIVGAL